MADIDFATIKRIRSEYLFGKTESEIAKDLKISPTTVKRYINDEGLGKLAVPEEMQYLYREVRIENEKIGFLKDKIYNLLNATVDEAMLASGKYLFIDKFKGLYEAIARIQLLNNDRPTDKTEQTTKVVDAAALLAQFPTTEDKLAFLKGQLRQPVDPQNKK